MNIVQGLGLLLFVVCMFMPFTDYSEYVLFFAFGGVNDYLSNHVLAAAKNPENHSFAKT